MITADHGVDEAVSFVIRISSPRKKADDPSALHAVLPASGFADPDGAAFEAVEKEAMAVTVGGGEIIEGAENGQCFGGAGEGLDLDVPRLPESILANKGKSLLKR